MAKRKRKHLEAGEMPIEDNPLEEMTPPEIILQEVDRMTAGIDIDPADWMAQNGSKESDEMNDPEEFERGETKIMNDSPEELSQSATSILRTDHERIDQLFQTYLSSIDTSNPNLDLIIQQICEELEIHSRIEEELFYPAVITVADPDTESFIEDSEQAHEKIKQLTTDLRALSAGSSEQDATLRELISEVAAHVEQEETMLLPFAEDALGDELIQLGEEILMRKEQIIGMGNAILSTNVGAITQS